MSSDFNQNAVSSMSSVISSIENDRQVYRWFLLLISLPKVQQKLSEDNQIKQEYQTLKKIKKTEILAYVVIVLMIICSYLIKDPLALLLGILPLIALVILFGKNRKSVATISEQFLLKNIKPDELTQQTLYQTCEYCSEKYDIPSLVDIITFQDFIGRKILLGTILFIPFIYPFKSWQILLTTLIVYIATLIMVNSSLVLRRLKSARD